MKLIKDGDEFILEAHKNDIPKIVKVVGQAGRHPDWVIVASSGNNHPYLQLSLENCKVIMNVVDVEKLAIEYDLYEKINFVGQTRAYKAGFQKAMELNKDKLFTLEDIKKAIDKAKQGSVKETHNGYGIPTEPRFVLDDLSYDEIIQSLQQPTEIEVEIEMEDVIQLKKRVGGITNMGKPKLDSEGCLILKINKPE
jgi:hypothetical protein